MDLKFGLNGEMELEKGGPESGPQGSNSSSKNGWKVVPHPTVPNRLDIQHGQSGQYAHADSKSSGYPNNASGRTQAQHDADDANTHPNEALGDYAHRAALEDHYGSDVPAVIKAEIRLNGEVGFEKGGPGSGPKGGNGHPEYGPPQVGHEIRLNSSSEINEDRTSDKPFTHVLERPASGRKGMFDLRNIASNSISHHDVPKAVVNGMNRQAHFENPNRISANS